MQFSSVRIITGDLRRLVTFYETAIGLRARWLGEQFAELVGPACTLALASVQTVDLFGPGSAEPESNRSMTLDFQVEDVDREFERLTDELAPEIVHEPTMMPWGNRSLMFRDPDGNLVNFFAPVTEQARARFAR